MEFGFVKPAFSYAIVVNNIADLCSCAWPPHDPVMAIKRAVKTEVSVRLHSKAESSPYMKYDGKYCLNC